MINVNRALLISWICISSGQVITAFYKSNWSTADLLCKSNSGLITLEDLVNDTLNLIDDTSYWVHGPIKYSRFVSWQGCYESFHKSFKLNTEDNSIYSCIDLCNKDRSSGFQFIGLQTNICFCLLYNQFLNAKITSDKICGNKNVTQGATTNVSVNVYEVHETGHIFHYNATANIHQCVYATLQQDKVSYGIDSCYNNVYGYICIDGSNQQVSETCKPRYSLLDDSFHVCIKNISTDWFGAIHDCSQFNGKLVSLQLSTERLESMRIKMQPAKKYWTGIFRDFRTETVPVTLSNDSVCLSAEKKNHKIIFYQDYCSSLKMPLCKTNASFSNPTQSMPVGEIIPSTSGKSNTDVKLPTVWPDSVAKPDTSQVAIISTVSSVALLLCIIVAIVIVRKLRTGYRRNKNRATLNKLQSDANIALNEPDRLASVEIGSASTTYNGDPVIEETHYALPEDNKVTTEENVYDRTDESLARGIEINIEGKDNIYSHTAQFINNSEIDDYDVVHLRADRKAQHILNE